MSGAVVLLKQFCMAHSRHVLCPATVSCCADQIAHANFFLGSLCNFFSSAGDEGAGSSAFVIAALFDFR